VYRMHVGCWLLVVAHKQKRILLEVPDWRRCF
jgi:hypothetical protein